VAKPTSYGKKTTDMIAMMGNCVSIGCDGLYSRKKRFFLHTYLYIKPFFTENNPLISSLRISTYPKVSYTFTTKG